MTAFEAFFGQLIDYAGLFPPAKLPLDQALCNYANYCSDKDAWMLGRFVVPATRLAEIAPFASVLCDEGLVPFSALGRDATKFTEVCDTLNHDMADVRTFLRQHQNWAAVEVLETKASAEALADTDVRNQLVGMAAGSELTLFLEVPLSDHWSHAITALQSMRPHGFKLRCGGLEASAFPTPEQVASVICACRDANVPLKCTAGLHHPVRHFSAGVQARMHGFLNVFGAGVLARIHRLDVGMVQRILEEEDRKAFVFDKATFRWRDLSASVDQVTDARRHAMISFGSCSFDEPRDDLRSLGLMP